MTRNSIDLPDRRIGEECGVVALAAHPDATDLAQLALVALQHRGQESAGIAATTPEGELVHRRGMGLVGDALDAAALEDLRGATTAIGHVRYSTAGASDLANAQPLAFRVRGRQLVLAHNGNLVNAEELRRELEQAGAIFQTSSDTEVLAHLVARAGTDDLLGAVREALAVVDGGFALCMLVDGRLVLARDRHGLRPLALGRVDDSWCAASESCALDTIGGSLVRDIEPGELVVIDGPRLDSARFAEPAERATCTFEHIYFARPDSDVDGVNVHSVRRRFGTRLAQIAPADADVVTGVPDSSTSSAIGYAEATGIPLELGLVKSRYIGRTFIAPSQAERTHAVRMKLSAVRSVVDGQRVVMVDDSLVRGTTSRRIVALLREFGAREVHVRIAAPPVAHPCFYGIDTSQRDELAAARMDVEQIRESIKADSLAFLDVDDMGEAMHAAGGARDGLCNACFTGCYPTKLASADAERAGAHDTAGAAGARA